MLFFLFIILAGCAVKCGDARSNYYVIEMPVEDTAARRPQKQFNVYWNVPTMQCKSKRIPFTNLYEKYGIIQNENDSFRGEQVAILYDPGLFPALLESESSGKFKFRNGGVPQEGNITKHIHEFKLSMEQSIPDVNFQGIGIIDFESWRPIFRQNFGDLVPYKEVSVQIERKIHWWWPDGLVQREAKQRFEEAAREFMQTTISIATQMRPKARWGYYGYPYCFNVATSNTGETCAHNVRTENNQIPWLWKESTALYPSVYSSKDLNSQKLAELIRGRIAEASRVRTKGIPILPYFWFRYRDGKYFSEPDLETVLKTLYKSSASGFIIWGSSKDVNTKEKCNNLLQYVDNILGPAISRYVKQSLRTEDELPTETVKINTTNDLFTYFNENVVTTDSTTYEPTLGLETSQNESLEYQPDNVETQVNQDSQWNPSDAYNRDFVVQDVEEDLNNKMIENKYTSNNYEYSNHSAGNNILDILTTIHSNSKMELDTKNENLTTESLASNKVFYTVPFTSSNSVSKNPIVEEVPTGSHAFSSGSIQNIRTAEQTSPMTLKYDYEDEIKTFISEMNNLVHNNENENYEYNESIPINDTSILYKDFSTIDQENQSKQSNFPTQSDYTQYDDFETVTEMSSVSSDTRKYHTKDFNIITTTSINTDTPNIASTEYTPLVESTEVNFENNLNSDSTNCVSTVDISKNKNTEDLNTRNVSLINTETPIVDSTEYTTIAESAERYFKTDLESNPMYTTEDSNDSTSYVTNEDTNKDTYSIGETSTIEYTSTNINWPSNVDSTLIEGTSKNEETTTSIENISNEHTSRNIHTPSNEETSTNVDTCTDRGISEKYLTKLSTPNTVNEVDFNQIIDETKTDDIISSITTENLSLSMENTASTINSGLFEKIAKLSILKFLENRPFKKTFKEDITENNFTSFNGSSTSSPDKVVAYIL